MTFCPFSYFRSALRRWAQSGQRSPSPLRPSSSSRAISRCPEWAAVSSITWRITHRTVGTFTSASGSSCAPRGALENEVVPRTRRSDHIAAGRMARISLDGRSHTNTASRVVGWTALVPGQGRVRSGHNLLEPVSLDISKVLDHSRRRPTRGQDRPMPRLFIQTLDDRTYRRSLICRVRAEVRAVRPRCHG